MFKPRNSMEFNYLLFVILEPRAAVLNETFIFCIDILEKR